MSDSARSAGTIIARCVIVVILAIAFGYVEAAVVVYLREIFHPDGFSFPLAAYFLADKSRDLLLTEVGREAATIVLILSACLLAGHNRRQRLAYFLIIFAVWDIFYYVWLKVLIGWPGSVLDWDILFLIPFPWAGPVLAPVLVSAAMLFFAGIILYRDSKNRPVKAGFWDWAGFSIAGVIVIISFCIAGRYMQSPDYAEHFSWLLFVAGLLGVISVFAKCVLRKTPTAGVGAK
ncbi:MAG: hypothetical protein ABII09_12295 [Planctomycetota bacterium]